MASLNDIIAAIDSLRMKLDEANIDITYSIQLLDTTKNAAQGMGADGLAQRLDAIRHDCEEVTSLAISARHKAEQIITTIKAIIDGSQPSTSGTTPQEPCDRDTSPDDGASPFPKQPVLPPGYGPVVKQPGRAPNARHNLNRIGKAAPSKANNTVAIPPLNMNDDIAAINAGQAQYDPETQSYITSGRRYKIKDNGTMYPLEGPGLINLSREEFNALKAMVKHRGNLEQAWESIRRDPRISRDTFNSVRDRIFRHHKDYKGH